MKKTILCIDDQKDIRDLLTDDLLKTHERSMGGEDFSAYLRKVPGVFIKFGTAAPGLAPALHTGHFDIHEEAIITAVSVLSWIIIAYLHILNGPRSK